MTQTFSLTQTARRKNGLWVHGAFYLKTHHLNDIRLAFALANCNAVVDRDIGTILRRGIAF